MLQKRQLASHKKRKTTDLLCLVIFFCATLVLLIAGLYCSLTGSISKLDIPYDSDGKGCTLDYPSHPYIYFPSPQYDSLWVTTCVKQCPTSADKQLDCQTNSIVKSCLQNHSVDNKQAFHIYSTQLFRGSVCLPTDTLIRQKVMAGIKAHPLQEMFRSVLHDWTLLLLMLPIVIAMVLVAMVLIRLTAGYVIYVLYAVAVSCFIGFGVFLAVPSNGGDAFILKKDKTIATILSVLSFILASVILCVFCSYRTKIKAAVKYIDQSNEFFKENYILLLLPFILSGFLMLLVVFWAFLTLSFYSMSTPARQPNQLPFEHYKLTPSLVALLLGNFFYLLWGVFFLMHTGSFIVSGTVVNWQYSRSNPYLSSWKSYLSSHMGSVCMGSFLTTLLGLFKFQLDQADCAQREQEKEKQKERKCMDWVKGCYGCLCCCCVNFLFKCFHHAAYVYQNLTGLTYCHSAGQIYQLIRDYKDQWSIIAFLYLIFDQFIPMTFTVAGTLIANFLVDGMQPYRSGTANRLVLLLVVALISYAICQFFIGIYSETIESLFVVQQFHTNVLANADSAGLRLSEFREVQEKPQSPRYSLFSKNT